ncbi:MFS transporter [Actinomadura madurae]|uniref:MFS transporter n=1 Tax=Actinomadura madurae TaxID=1993 RepID=UPI0020D244C4|nr:MFS transporter [Actinomadura madurae]MCQ0011364.1 MFS transporter [Actinomadura madurae]
MRTAAAEHGEEGRRRWRALSVCLVSAFMTLLDVSIVNVALPSIRAGLDASPAELQWIVSGYALTFGLVLVPAGRLGDARSRRAVFMTGLALFTVASAAAGMAPTVLFLLLARLVQGVASGILNPQVAGLIQQLFQGAERGRAFGALGAVIGIATAVGPLLGGALIALSGPEEGWRWVFYVNIPVGVAALLLAWRLLPAPVYGERQGLDPLGVLLLGAGVFCVLLPLVQEQQWRTDLKWLLVLGGAVLIALFALWERRAGAPMVDLALFRLRSYTLGAAIALLFFAGFTAVFFIFTLYLQNGLGYSALGAGLAITPFAVGSGAASAARRPGRDALRAVARRRRPVPGAGRPRRRVGRGRAGAGLRGRLGDRGPLGGGRRRHGPRHLAEPDADAVAGGRDRGRQRGGRPADGPARRHRDGHRRRRVGVLRDGRRDGRGLGGGVPARAHRHPGVRAGGAGGGRRGPRRRPPRAAPRRRASAGGGGRARRDREPPRHR